jgi:hypothetical protein
MRVRISLLIDFESEERKLREDIHWATELEDQVTSRARSRVRNLDDQRKDLESHLEELNNQKEHLTDIIEGRVKPRAVDLPETQADDFKTKLRLRIKGVRGIAIERAENDLIPLQEEIDEANRKIDGLESESNRLQEKIGKYRDMLENFADKTKAQRSLLRRAENGSDRIRALVGLFGWFDPSILSRKIFDEGVVATAQLNRKDLTVERLEDKVRDLDDRADEVKENLRDSLGEAYDLSLIPLVFKDGRNPEGERYLRNQITVNDVRSLDLINKISNPKSGDRKADRLSPVLMEHLPLIQEALVETATICELKAEEERLLDQAKGAQEAAGRSLRRKTDLFNEMVDCLDTCGALQSLVSDYLNLEKDRQQSKDRIMRKVEPAGSNL